MNKLQRLLQSRILILTVCAAGIGGTFQYGYNISIINAPTSYIQVFMNKTWQERTGIPLEDNMILLLWSFTVSAFPLGGLAGAVVAGPMAIVLGRKMSLLVNNVFVIIAAVLSGFSQMAKSFEMIMLSRFFTGVNAGVSMNIQPMYLAESAPKKLRGAVALTSASFTALGLVLGQVVGLRELLGGEESWPLLLASNAVPALIQFVALPWFPESPRYLLIDRGDRESCISALQKLRGNSDLGAELEEMLAEQAAAKGQRAKKPWELFQNPAVRWQLMSIIVLSSAMQLCGNDSMYFYAAYVFQEAGIPQDKIPYVVIGMGSCELITSVTCPLWLNIYYYSQSDYLSRQLWMQPQRLTRTAAEESIAFSFLSSSREHDYRLCWSEATAAGGLYLHGRMGHCLHGRPKPTDSDQLDALSQHGLHFCLHPELWNWTSWCNRSSAHGGF
ncbi:solute carrier family 2, facilitated glucose transporter member 11-like isoform X4 [Oxyura jamaicensis]|uniref:solute carrier family 2, facilitated glucose transporter member 11-like isoform X4 n=1 Tax=Oxyura jamaicensis TaxID=8884 RepID=UPI0015A5A937|nr:solute carrier family 2, facilitated glucose transporter member 11-like isoform X4 [Oxyura jamaicensis]